MRAEALAEDPDWKDWKVLITQTQERYLTEELIMSLLLSGQEVKLRELEVLCQMAISAAQFGQFQRAIRYLLLFCKQCGQADSKRYENDIRVKFKLS